MLKTKTTLRRYDFEGQIKFVLDIEQGLTSFQVSVTKEELASLGEKIDQEVSAIDRDLDFEAHEKHTPEKDHETCAICASEMIGETEGAASRV